MTEPPIEELEVAVRAWVTYPADEARQPGGTVDLGPSEWRLVFDCETTVDAAQRLRVGAFHVYDGDELHEAGFFMDPAIVIDTERDAIRSVARDQRMDVMTVTDFVRSVFLYYAWDLRCIVIGHNLPFDLSRLAIGHTTTRSRDRTMRRGFSFQLSDEPAAPRLLIKPTGNKAAFIRFAQPGRRGAEQRSRDRGADQPNHGGYFVDTSVLGGALLGKKARRLKNLAELLDTEHRKLHEPDFSGPVDQQFLAYLVGDVVVTWECFRKLEDRYNTYGLTETPIYRIQSEASIGKAHLKQIDLTPWRKSQPDVPDWVIAALLETYHGGRVECRIRKTATPGVYVDFVSQYPTVYVLQHLWRYQIATGIAWDDEDPSITQQLLDELTIDDVLNPDLWPQLHALVLIDPDGDRLPTRAQYARPRDDLDIDPGSYAWNVGLSYRHGGPAQWYTLADACGSKLETGKAPRILRCLRFRLLDPQPGLRTIAIGGQPDANVDPYRDDLIQRLIELRGRTKQKLAMATARGDGDEASRLDAIQQGLKIAANADAYGIGIELNTTSIRKPVPGVLHLPDQTSHQVVTKKTEHEGTWFHPLIGTLAAAGGRLLLAAAIHETRRRGGEYVFCDTDSLFIAATPDGHRPRGLPDEIPIVPWTVVEEIVARFEALNRYAADAVPGSILQIEKENYDKSGTQRLIEAYSIASKRYTLLTRDQDGLPRVMVGKRSEHGLGHLMSPIPESGDEDPTWIDLWWQHILERELGIDSPDPDWFDLPALGRLTITTPSELAHYRRFNRGRMYADQIKPFNFHITAHPHPIELGGERPTHLTAPYEREPSRWRHISEWIDRRRPNRGPFRVRTSNLEYADQHSVAARSYHTYFIEYLRHLDAKSSPGRSARLQTSRRIRARPDLIRIGKEARRLNTALEAEPLTVGAVVHVRHCRGCGAPLTRRQQKWHSERCRSEVRRR